MITEKDCLKAVKLRCKDCQPNSYEFDEGLCRDCSLKKPTKKNILSYCKKCLNGNNFEMCQDEICSLRKIIPELKQEMSKKIQGK